MKFRVTALSVGQRLSDNAASAIALNSTIAQASAASLFSKVMAIEACKANSFQPNVVWHPSIFSSMMQLDLRDQVSQEIFLTGAFEPELLWLFSRIVQEGMVVVDGGAHIGFFTLAFGQLVGPSGIVHAFEPIGRTRQHLETNVRNASLSNVVVNDTALWSAQGTININDWGPSLSAFNGISQPRLAPGVLLPDGVTTAVSTISLDIYFSEKEIYPDIVKLDVENAEYQVIQGMASILSSARPTIVLEVGDFPDANASVGTTYSVLSLLRNCGYEFFDIKDLKLFSHELVETPYAYGNLVAVHCDKVGLVKALVSSEE